MQPTFAPFNRPIASRPMPKKRLPSKKAALMTGGKNRNPSTTAPDPAAGTQSSYTRDGAPSINASCHGNKPLPAAGTKTSLTPESQIKRKRGRRNRKNAKLASSAPNEVPLATSSPIPSFAATILGAGPVSPPPTSSVNSQSTSSKSRKRKKRHPVNAGISSSSSHLVSLAHPQNHPSSEVALKRVSPSSSGPVLSALQAKMKARLEGARFRDINEMLYTSRGDHALTTFKNEPALFEAYHKGFREQVQKWPRNPLDDIIAWVRRQPRTHTFADFGCGEARLAASCPHHTVHSFDLVAPGGEEAGRAGTVIACDMANVPLPSESVHGVIFCLSLMATNMMDSLREAVRVCVEGGVVKVVEVRSRFEGQGEAEEGGKEGGKEGGGGGIEKFVAACQALGLACKRLDRTNKMFFLVDFVKVGKEKETGGKGHKRKGATSGSAPGNVTEKGEEKIRRGEKRGGGEQGKGSGQDMKAGPGSPRAGGRGKGGKEDGKRPDFRAKPCLYKRR